MLTVEDAYSRCLRTQNERRWNTLISSEFHFIGISLMFTLMALFVLLSLAAG